MFLDLNVHKDHVKKIWLLRTHYTKNSPPKLQVFFLSILWCSQSGDHPLEDLAKKFGYELDMKVKSIFLSFDYPLKPIGEIWQFVEIFLKIWWIWVIFHLKIICIKLKLDHSFLF